MHISLISQISSLQHPFRGFHHCVTALETTSGARHAPGRATGTACRHRLGRTTGPGRQRSPSLATHALTAATKHTASARAMPSRGARGRNPGAGGSESRLGRPARSSATEGARIIPRVHQPYQNVSWPSRPSTRTQTIGSTAAGEGSHQPFRGRVLPAVCGVAMSQ